MNSGKAEARPTLQGQRIKTRKRDEKERTDPQAFRDSIIAAFSDILNQKSSPNSEVTEVSAEIQTVNNGSHKANPLSKSHLDQLSKFLDEKGSSKDPFYDYKVYGEHLLDILLAGGLLGKLMMRCGVADISNLFFAAPGGTIITDQDTSKIFKTDLCIFACPADDVDLIRDFAQVFIKLVRRYKYLERPLEEEFKKVIRFLKGFAPDERNKLARVVGFLLATGQLNPAVVGSALNDSIIKDGIAGEFLVTVLQTWLKEKDPSTVWTGIRKAGVDQKIMDFFPANKRTAENLEVTFVSAGMGPLLEFQKAGLGDRAKRELQGHVSELVKESAPVKEIVSRVEDFVSRNKMSESEVVVLLWNTLMNSIEWNKKEELVAEQALKHLKGYTTLLGTFTTTVKSELALMNRVQEYSYENMSFLKVFYKIIQLFYKGL